MPPVKDIFLAVAAIPFIYYLISIVSSWRYFRQPASAPDLAFTPPLSILKPFRGLDPDACENLDRHYLVITEPAAARLRALLDPSLLTNHKLVE